MNTLFPDLLIKKIEPEFNEGIEARKLYSEYIDAGYNSFEAFYKTKEQFPNLRKSENGLWVKKSRKKY